MAQWNTRVLPASSWRMVGFLEKVGLWHEVTRRWPGAMSTRVAVLVKERPDGSQKVRFIMDALRSGVNRLLATNGAHRATSRH